MFYQLADAEIVARLTPSMMIAPFGEDDHGLIIYAQ